MTTYIGLVGPVNKKRFAFIKEFIKDDGSEHDVNLGVDEKGRTKGIFIHNMMLPAPHVLIEGMQVSFEIEQTNKGFTAKDVYVHVLEPLSIENGDEATDAEYRDVTDEATDVEKLGEAIAHAVAESEKAGDRSMSDFRKEDVVTFERMFPPAEPVTEKVTWEELLHRTVEFAWPRIKGALRFVVDFVRAAFVLSRGLFRQ